MRRELNATASGRTGTPSPPEGRSSRDRRSGCIQPTQQRRDSLVANGVADAGPSRDNCSCGMRSSRSRTPFRGTSPLSLGDSGGGALASVAGTTEQSRRLPGGARGLEGKGRTASSYGCSPGGCVHAKARFGLGDPGARRASGLARGRGPCSLGFDSGAFEVSGVEGSLAKDRVLRATYCFAPASVRRHGVARAWGGSAHCSEYLLAPSSCGGGGAGGNHHCDAVAKQHCCRRRLD
jgi:hypothetical protein